MGLTWPPRKNGSIALLVGRTTLEKLDTHLAKCDAVIHVIGDGLGYVPPESAVGALLARHPEFLPRLNETTGIIREQLGQCSYTQWEAYLAVFHGVRLHIYRPDDGAPRENGFVPDDRQIRLQEDHYNRIRELGRDRDTFLNPERLSSAVLADLNDILPGRESRTEVRPTRLTHTASVLIGRECELTLLDDAWNEDRTNVVVIRGKGGEGKTSLVAAWMAELAYKGWRGAERVLDWSFYSQGTRDQSTATSEFFFNTVLRELGDPDPTEGSPEDRAARMADLVNEKRTLLVLDGLEPLQYPPGPMHGSLKDGGMAALLRALAANNAGLVVITSRERVDEIQQHYERSVIDHDLQFMSPLAGAQVLHHAGARRAGSAEIAPDDAELQRASEDVHGHALTLFLIGNYLKLIREPGFDWGDIRQRDTLRLAEAEHEYRNDATRPYGHAFKAMEAYERWFAAGDDAAFRQLSVLRMLGLFDRPASADCLTALRDSPIQGLTEVWKGQSERQWSIALNRLRNIKLIKTTADRSVDCHPLIREYFYEGLRNRNPAAFKAGHSRLFEHLCACAPESTRVLKTFVRWRNSRLGKSFSGLEVLVRFLLNKKYREKLVQLVVSQNQMPSIGDLQPLYQAVFHGCHSGRREEALQKVYRERIQRGTREGGYYSSRRLGAIDANLAAVSAFFEQPWSLIYSDLTLISQDWLLSEASFYLSALGRLREAQEPMRVAMERCVAKSEWENAATVAHNLSELEVSLGRLEPAYAYAKDAVEFADRSDTKFEQVNARAIAADALFQAGEIERARKLFEIAETLQCENNPEKGILNSIWGFRYCNLIISPIERAVWKQQFIDYNSRLTQSQRRISSDKVTKERNRLPWQMVDLLNVVERRVRTTLNVDSNNVVLLSKALDHLTLARIEVYRVSLSLTSMAVGNNSNLAIAIDAVRASSDMTYTPFALLTASHWHALRLEEDIANRYLMEAQRIAERGPMPLHLADVHLHRARLFRDRNELARAKELIEKHGYWRRREELADAEAASEGW